jgi:hypothetical protein
MINSYGLDTALKVAKNQAKFHMKNVQELDYWTRVAGHLIGIQTKKFVYGTR